MTAKPRVMIVGAMIMVAGIILLGVSWASSIIYRLPTDALVYSPWIPWSLIIGGFGIMTMALVLGKESG